MICFPNAKINLGLYITEKRNDGFHNIETVFYPISLNDALEFVPSKTSKSTMRAEGIDINSAPTDNLVYKAYEILSSHYSIPPIEICLLKHIPIGAGLGGGSADAAFMIKELNNHFKLNLTTKKLQEYALKLGSDCPFFIENKPKLATGRGELFSDISLDLKGLHLILINPNIHVSTKEAYSGISPKKPQYNLKEVIEGSIFNWKTTLKNDFEEGVFNKYPEIKIIKDKLYDAGAIYASMSGSGSTVFGIFEKIPEDLTFPVNYFIWKERL